MRTLLPVSMIAAWGLGATFAHAALLAGAAKVDVSPTTPIRLSGYAARTTESDRIEQPIFARALAMGEDRTSAVVVVTIDAIGLPAVVCDAIAKKALGSDGIARDHLAFCATHDHNAPHLASAIPNMFGMELPQDQVERIGAYTEHVIEGAASAIHDALAAMQPATLAFGHGEASFGANRRTKGGPVDHDVPLLLVRDAKGERIATLAAYACHCTTLGPAQNFCCGDWAGYASETLETAHPGSIALIAIGCGADQNPSPGGTLENSQQHGRELAAEIERLAATNLAPIDAAPTTRFDSITLPFGVPRTREEWEARKKQGGAVAHHAEYFLGKLEANEPIPDAIPYPVETIRFGEQLAMAFLAGEVVVDYALRLKRELKSEKLFLAAYSNDLPCYIPSRRILQEGGYEGESAMTYYRQPTKFAPVVEDIIVRAVRAQLPLSFVSDVSLAEFPPPPSPEEALAAIEVDRGLRVELAASEPLVESPVAIDFAPDRAMFVAEMRDYPNGMKGNLEPGGRIRRLVDVDDDGVFDQSSVFLDGIAFPTGVMAYGGGVLVCAAPDILFARDVDGDGIADSREVLFTGFPAENEQARPNSLRLGLDGWIYGASGLFGGAITSTKTGEVVDVHGRDFRIDPKRGKIEAISGISQQGRARNDFGEWFGCDSNIPVFDFPLEDAYLARNPFLSPPPGNHIAIEAADGDPRRVFPISPHLQRYNDYDHENHVTSACGLEIYRDDTLGDDYRDNAFCCEPVGNVVMRYVLKRNGATYSATRPEDALDRDFMASHSNWFRPVAAKAGPDGALYVVDMARFLIEHPRWVGAEQLAHIDIRAGEHLGRIWRVLRAADHRKHVPDLATAKIEDVVAAMRSTNGALRDIAHAELLRRNDAAPASLLAGIIASDASAAARVQAMYALDQLGGLTDPMLDFAILSNESWVRAHAVRLAEPRLAKNPRGQLERRVTQLAKDAQDFVVARQVLLTLPECRALRPDWMGGLGVANTVAVDPYGVTLLLSTIDAKKFAPMFKLPKFEPGESIDVLDRFETFAEGMCATAEGRNENLLAALALSSVISSVRSDDGAERRPVPWRMLARALETCDHLHVDISHLPNVYSSTPQANEETIARLVDSAYSIVADAGRPLEERAAACEMLVRTPANRVQDLALLGNLLDPSIDPILQRAAMLRLFDANAAASFTILLNAFSSLGPDLRGELLDRFLERDIDCVVLLDAIENRHVPISAIDALRRERLVSNPDPRVGPRAVTLFGKPSSAKAVLENLTPVLALAGDRARGAAHFDHLCASCHSFRGRGNEVGADLSGLTDRSSQYLLLSIVDPNAAVDVRYQAYDLETSEHRKLLGIVEGESSTAINLRLQGGVHESIPRSEILAFHATGRSLMPEGLVLGLSHQEVADLIAFLQTAPKRLDALTEAECADARAKFLQGSANGCLEILDGQVLPAQNSFLGPTPMRFCRQTDGRSRVAWKTAIVPDTLREGAKMRFRLAAAMGWNSQPGKGFTLLVNGREAMKFDVKIDDATVSRNDGDVVMTWYVQAKNSEDATGVLTIEIADSWLKKGEGALLEVVGEAAGSERWFGVLDVH